ncbi:MAG: histidine kinase [Butyrivibrio sp.]|uniref:sensor histidine kinase n=1 Tax=Butyrivibrio sp. TaxID=28121 RepID=UPI001B0DB0ED|nr:histidine kinase [Butyrivibrio sp.]MBO6240939.1 histidine kinase [Butyrivibrio sp.]
MNKFLNSPLQTKIISACVLANLIIFMVNLFLIFGINSMSKDMEMVYEGNRSLNELSTALNKVQDSMTEYLSSKTSDSLENYYINAQEYGELTDELGDKVTDFSFNRMERNIKYMSENYLEKVEQTIESKRGRNVEKYRTYYEDSTELYEDIQSYITSLNLELFVINSEEFIALIRTFRTFEIIGVAVMTFVMIGNVIIITSFVRAMIMPLKNLSDSANEIAEGNFDVSLPSVSYSDEVGIVTGAFNKMIISIKDYIEQLKISMANERYMQEKELMMEAHLKDAQLKYLQAQINPHFLFNTLNAGAQLAMMEGADRTYEYVQTVADFFRYNVKNQKDLVTVREEVTLVDNYIHILNVRFSGDIGYEKQIDERLLNYKMPSMILQPIVENAVNHGIREMAGDGKIVLKVYRQDKCICLSVKDNGKGISKENIEKILAGSYVSDENAYDNNGIGMDNVISRLRLFAGREEVMQILSKGEGCGCEVIVSIPFEGAKDVQSDDC